MHTTLSRATPAGGRLPAREQWGLWGVLLCSLAGTLVALYLLTLHFQISGNPSRGLCTFTDTLSCDKVLASEYAEMAGVPVALFGVVGFALLAVMAAARLWWGNRVPRGIPTVLVLVGGAGLAFELGMTWIEVFVIQALCPYCITALGLIAASFVAAGVAWREQRASAGMEVGRG